MLVQTTEDNYKENNDRTADRIGTDKVAVLNLLANAVLQNDNEIQTKKNLINDVNKLKIDTDAEIKILENIKDELESNIATEISKESINNYNEEIEKQNLANQIESALVANNLAETENKYLQSKIKEKKKNLLTDEFDYLDRANLLKYVIYY